MKDVIYLLFDLLTTLAKLLRSGGSRTVIAENLLLKRQLIIPSRSRQRAPNLTTQDRTILGFLPAPWPLLAYYNEHRCHSGRDGATPADSKPGNVIDLRNYRWKKHCRGLFQLPVAA